MNEEFLVNADHQSALITSLPFVHTARRTYRLNGPVKPRDCGQFAFLGVGCENLPKPYHLEEGEVGTRFPYVNLRKDHYHLFLCELSNCFWTVNCTLYIVNERSWHGCRVFSE